MNHDDAHPSPPSPRWLRPLRRTARQRLTLLYGAAFVACGACGATMLAVTFLLYGQLTPPPPTVHRHLSTMHGSAAHVTPTVPRGARPPNVTIRVAGLGPIVLYKQQLLVASIIVLALFVVAAAEVDRLFQPFHRLGLRSAAATAATASACPSSAPSPPPTPPPSRPTPGPAA